jgi:hypothetical protein
VRGAQGEGPGKHAGVDASTRPAVKYEALHSVLDEGWCLYQQSLDEAKAARADVPEVTRWTRAPKLRVAQRYPLDVCAAPDPRPGTSRPGSSWRVSRPQASRIVGPP